MLSDGAHCSGVVESSLALLLLITVLSNGAHEADFHWCLVSRLKGFSVVELLY